MARESKEFNQLGAIEEVNELLIDELDELAPGCGDIAFNSNLFNQKPPTSSNQAAQRRKEKLKVNHLYSAWYGVSVPFVKKWCQIL